MQNIDLKYEKGIVKFVSNNKILNTSDVINGVVISDVLKVKKDKKGYYNLFFNNFVLNAKLNDEIINYLSYLHPSFSSKLVNQMLDYSRENKRVVVTFGNYNAVKFKIKRKNVNKFKRATIGMSLLLSSTLVTYVGCSAYDVIKSCFESQSTVEDDVIYIDSIVGNFNSENLQDVKILTEEDLINLELQKQNNIEDSKIEYVPTVYLDEFSDYVTNIKNSNTLTSYYKYFMSWNSNLKAIDLIVNKSIEYGIDPYLMLSLCLNESTLGTMNSSEAYGLFQIESTHLNEETVITNYATGETKTIKITVDNLLNDEINMEVAISFLQKYLKKYNGNIELSLFAYNMGDGISDMILFDYVVKSGIPHDVVLANKLPVELLNMFNKFSNEPLVYFAELSHEASKEYFPTISWVRDVFLVDQDTYGIGTYSTNVLNTVAVDSGLYSSLGNYYLIDYKSMKKNDVNVEETRSEQR